MRPWHGEEALEKTVNRQELMDGGGRERRFAVAFGFRPVYGPLRCSQVEKECSAY